MADMITPAVHQAMQTSLDRALDKLSSLETPTPAAAKAAPPAPPPPEVEPQFAVGEKRTVGSYAPGEAPTHTVTGVEVAPAAPPEPAKTTVAPSAAPLWGPQQQQALHQILQSNTAMEAELAALREKAAEYETLINDAKAGDIGGFADKVKLDRAQMLDALKNEGSAPATLPYVKKLEAKLAALEQQWQQRDSAETQRRELSDIASQLQSKPEYGILKQIPDAAARIQSLLRQREADAKSRGELAPALTVEQAATMLKSDVVATLKRFLSDDGVRKELGLGDPVTPDSVKAPRSKKAITSSMSSQGSTHKTTTGYDPDERLRLALRKVTGG